MRELVVVGRRAGKPEVVRRSAIVLGLFFGCSMIAGHFLVDWISGRPERPSHSGDIVGSVLGASVGAVLFVRLWIARVKQQPLDSLPELDEVSASRSR
jgi:hypothetical protein